MTTFIALGASATALGQTLLRWRYMLNLVGGAVMILFGLFMDRRRGSRPWTVTCGSTGCSGGRPSASYVLGLAG